MILKKPYAFFIKHFRLFHLIMFVLLGAVAYETNLTRVFFNSYLNETAYILPINTGINLFSSWVYIWGIIIIIFSIIVFLVMNKKEKPATFYALNILVIFVTLIFMIYSKSMVSKMESELLAVTLLRALRDIGNVIFIIQCVMLLVTFVRAIGFDIKKFDFRKDLQELNVSAEDSEEFEVQLNFDKNEMKRNFKKNSREFKYFLLENKKMITIFSVIGIILISTFIYFNFWKFSKTYKINEYFETKDFTIKVNNSYLTSYDYKLNKITDNALVLIDIDTKKSDSIINTAKTQLKIGNKIYYPTTNAYKNKFPDLGNVYNGEKLSNGINKFILIYEIPQSLSEEKMTFIYLDDYSKTLFGEKYKELKVNLDSLKLDTPTNYIQSKIENIMDFDNQSIKGNLFISNYQINRTFDTSYSACISKTECYDFKQYLQPSFTGYQDKTILKMSAILNYKEDSIIKDDLSNLISKYGKIIYTIDGKVYTTTDINATNFSLKVDNANYYIEVPKIIEQASTINLVFNIRNQEYNYGLK